MKVYADYVFYKNVYLRDEDIFKNESSFNKYALVATFIIHNETLGKADNYLEDDRVKLCMCEIAEKHFMYDISSSKLSEGIASERVGEYSVTYKAISEAEKNYIDYKILTRYLAMTGLLYKGA